MASKKVIAFLNFFDCFSGYFRPSVLCVGYQNIGGNRL